MQFASQVRYAGKGYKKPSPKLREWEEELLRHGIRLPPPKKRGRPDEQHMFSNLLVGLEHIELDKGF
jgi:hypothetical protein